MKRVFAFLIAAMMAASLSVVAFADSTHQTSSNGRVDKQSSREAAEIVVETAAEPGQELRVEDNKDGSSILEQLVTGADGSEKLTGRQRAPYVFNVGVYNTADDSMGDGKYPTVKVSNIAIPDGYTFDYVLYYDGTKWVRGSSSSGIVGTMSDPGTLVLDLTNRLPDTAWNMLGGPTGAGAYKGVPIAVVVSSTGSGSDSDASATPLSPQTGEPTVAACLLGAAVTAMACAAFVMKSRKAD